jgi:hypothetical protein
MRRRSSGAPLARGPRWPDRPESRIPAAEPIRPPHASSPRTRPPSREARPPTVCARPFRRHQRPRGSTAFSRSSQVLITCPVEARATGQVMRSFLDPRPGTRPAGQCPHRPGGVPRSFGVRAGGRRTPGRGQGQDGARAQARNLTTLAIMIATGVVILMVFRSASPGQQTLFAYTWIWFLLFGGFGGVLTLQYIRGQGADLRRGDPARDPSRAEVSAIRVRCPPCRRPRTAWCSPRTPGA